MDTFNIISGIITIVSFVFALIIYLRERDLRKTLEASMISLIGVLDKIAALEENPDVTKKALALGITNARDHAIGILKIFSNANYRHKTYDYGINGDNYEDKLEKRKKVTASGGGCILEGQEVLSPHGSPLIERLNIGDTICGYDFINKEIVDTIVERIEKFIEDTYIIINDKIKVTPGHPIYLIGKGWKAATSAKIGDKILTSKKEHFPISSIKIEKGRHNVYEIHTSVHNLFVNDSLVHNAKP